MPSPSVPHNERVSPDAVAAELLEVVPAVMDAVRCAMRRHVGEELSVPQFRCLNYVAQDPGCTVSAVAAFLGVKLPTASAMVDRLVKAGAIELCADPHDRRRARLEVTPSGAEQLRHIGAQAHTDLSHSLALCDSQELLALASGLAVLRRRFSRQP